MKSSMHSMMNGYGSGAVPVAQLKADRAAAAQRSSSGTAKLSFLTNSVRQFHASSPRNEQLNMRDRRQERISTQAAPRADNLILSSTAIGRGVFDGSRVLDADPLAVAFKRHDPRMVRIKEGPPRPENYALSSGDVGDVRRAEMPAQPHQANPDIARRNPMVSLQRQRRKAAHLDALRQRHKVKDHDAHGHKLKPWQHDAANAREAERHYEQGGSLLPVEMATKKLFSTHVVKVKRRQGRGGGGGGGGGGGEGGGGGRGGVVAVLTDRSSIASTCTDTTIGGGVVHPLRTPRGVVKGWDRDNAVADMQASKLFNVPGLHDFFKPELPTSRSDKSTSRSDKSTSRSARRTARSQAGATNRSARQLLSQLSQL
jgi:hypothetical protein